MKQLKSCVEAEENNILKQEISQLQVRLHDEFLVRRALEKALNHTTLSLEASKDMSLPKDAMDLIKEVAVLELQVEYLEQNLLSLYRKTFDEKMSSESENSSSQQLKLVMSPTNSVNSHTKEHKLLDSSILRVPSSLSQRSEYSFRRSPSSKSLANAFESSHSLPLFMLEKSQADILGETSYRFNLSSDVSDQFHDTPNQISEEIIKCISAIYCDLADPPLTDQDYPISPASCSTPTDTSSSQTRHPSLFSSDELQTRRLSKDFNAIVEVQSMCRDNHKLIEEKLQSYRSLVYRLEDVDPRKMTHEEKLAFWINVHNALVMHAHLVYGIPKNNMKRIAMVLKAAYSVGGQIVDIGMIQSSLLGCSMPRPGHWLQFLFPSKKKSKIRDKLKGYAIQHPEPRLYFALSSGSYSDPVVRVYTPKRVLQDLEVAKEDYMQSNLSESKHHKILLPKIVESFAKSSDICKVGLIKMIESTMPECLKKNMPMSQYRKSPKNVEFVPHNFGFRYLLSRDL